MRWQGHRTNPNAFHVVQRCDFLFGIGDRKEAARVGKAKNDYIAKCFFDIGSQGFAKSTIKHMIGCSVVRKCKGHVQNINPRVIAGHSTGG